MTYQKVNILGIPFFKGNVEQIIKILQNEGGLVTVPAAPALVTIKEDKAYYLALQQSDIIIPDSGYMVLVWNIFFKEKISKISGLKLFNYFLTQVKSNLVKNVFLINPSDLDGQLNVDLLQSYGLDINEKSSYTAPFYKNKIEDFDLIHLLETQKPKWVLINIGGGTQEKLGLFLKNKLSYKPAILCTGAAIAFKTGRQVNIPIIVDRLYLGWFYRSMSNPKLFIPRYLKGFKLINLILKHKSKNII
jgi:N-acetylglucosaminyldiphosphoundecaprenol N-acetyl-beta-D-mannosaminyltransferase